MANVDSSVPTGSFYIVVNGREHVISRYLLHRYTPDFASYLQETKTRELNVGLSEFSHFTDWLEQQPHWDESWKGDEYDAEELGFKLTEEDTHNGILHLIEEGDRNSYFSEDVTKWETAMRTIKLYLFTTEHKFHF